MLLALLPAGCGDWFANWTASLGGNTAGQRGSVRVLFLNETPHRAVFTFGTFDPADQESRPDVEQFGPTDDDPTLDAEATSDIVTLTCGRVVAIGSPQLLDFIAENLSDADLIDEALVEGISFIDPADDSDADTDGSVDDASGSATTAGSALPFEALLGVDFPCESLLILRLEINDPGPAPFRVDFEVIPSASTR